MHGLNTSDHLPVTAVLSLQATQLTEKTNTQSPINWEKAISIGGLKLYQDRLGEVTSNCIGREYPCIDELDAEIEQVSQSIIKAAEMLPRYKPPRGRKKWYSNATLSRLSKEKKEAWDTWKAEGRPASGPVHEQIRTREEVRKRIRVCEANEERRRIQQIDQKFKARDKTRFRNKSLRRTGGKIRVGNEIISDPDSVLYAWKDHFEALGRSRKEIDDVVAAAEMRAEALFSESYTNMETILDIPFQQEELENALKKLRLKKSADHSGITAEHLLYGGQNLKLWLLQIMNAIAHLESIPDSLNLAVITPVYKGSGKDPLDRGSYRGISVTPIIAKLLELLILARLQTHLQELGFPHANQSGYRKQTSCADAIFSTAELMSHYLSEGENIYRCCYDLQKSIEYGVLLGRLYDVGISSKLWRLLRTS